MLAGPLVLLPPPALIGGALAAAAGLPFLGRLVGADLPLPLAENPSPAWLVTDPVGLVREVLLTGAYPALLWLPSLAVGLALGRASVRSPRFAAGLAAGGAALAGAAAGLSALFPGSGGGLVLAAAAPTALDLARTTGTALAVIGVLLWLDRRRHRVARAAVATVRVPLAAAGAMTLTFYTLHVLFLGSPLDVYEPLTGYVVQVVLVLLLGAGWRASAGRGPLETVASAAGARGARWAGGS